MSENGSRQLEAERALKAKVHRHLGMTAAVLGILAAGLGLRWISVNFNISPWAALGEAMPLLLIVLVILGIGILGSLGISRLALGIERLAKRKERDPARTGE